MNPRFEHVRHRPPASGGGGSDLVVACAPMHSQVNLSRIVRAAGCCGVTTVLAAGAHRIDPKITRDASDHVTVEARRSLGPALLKWKQSGYRLVGLEQTTNSQCLFDFRFPRQCVLVVGNERLGLSDDVLALLDDVVEIPVYGAPHSHNAATAAAMAMYEYCRQFAPSGGRQEDLETGR